MKKILSISALIFISGCASTDFQPELKNVPIDKSGVLHGTASLSTTVYQAPNDIKKFCLGRGADAAFEKSESGSISLSLISVGKPESEAGKETSNAGEQEMSGRTPGVLITRELFYRTCELIVNSQLDKKEAIEMFNNVLKVVGNVWARESSNTTVKIGDTLSIKETNQFKPADIKDSSGASDNQNSKAGAAPNVTGSQNNPGCTPQSLDFNPQTGTCP